MWAHQDGRCATEECRGYGFRTCSVPSVERCAPHFRFSKSRPFLWRSNFLPTLLSSSRLAVSGPTHLKTWAPHASRSPHIIQQNARQTIPLGGIDGGHADDSHQKTTARESLVSQDNKPREVHPSSRDPSCILRLRFDGRTTFCSSVPSR